MARWTMPFALNIRQKVIVGLAVSMVVIGSIGGMSFRYLREIERKQHLVEVADDLSNTILEIRRYEKNYLLYGSREDLEENRRYIQQGMDVLGKIVPEVEDLEGAPQLKLLEKEFTAYRELMSRLTAGVAQPAEHPDDAGMDQLRERGKRLVDLSQRLVTFERERILNIIRSLKTQLLSSLGLFLAVGAFLVPVVAHKIIRPLRVIEKTTLRIAEGNFNPIPVLDTRDETQSVVEAFNRMISEIEKRQDQLLQAKKLSSLGILTSGIAHQLNNPLNNISTSCQILLEEFEQAERDFLRKMLTNIEQEVHRARDIVRGLLEFSRVKEFSLVPTSLTDVVDRSVSLVSSQVPPGIDIVKDVPAGLVLDMDGQRMQQVFLNLLMNAIQAIEYPPGQIRIVARMGDDGEEAVLSVEDTGIGISEKDLGKVFDPFFTTKEVGMGTGLGLSIVYGVIQRHQGSISVESREGEGTRFIIRLPLHPVA